MRFIILKKMKAKASLLTLVICIMAFAGFGFVTADPGENSTAVHQLFDDAVNVTADVPVVQEAFIVYSKEYTCEGIVLVDADCDVNYTENNTAIQNDNFNSNLNVLFDTDIGSLNQISNERLSINENIIAFRRARDGLMWQRI